jgi:hypothetical protein
MATDDRLGDLNREVEAIKAVIAALNGLDPVGQTRVLGYVIDALGLELGASSSGAVAAATAKAATAREMLSQFSATEPRQSENIAKAQEDVDDEQDDLEGINSVAQKWMKRNGLSSSQLSSLFSLGIDDIDLVSNSVPGKDIKQRLRSVVLLKAVASYLSSGAARLDSKKLKEAASHYKADAGGNFTTYMASMASEVSGTAATGYTLTSRGLTAATELIKSLLDSKKK